MSRYVHEGRPHRWPRYSQAAALVSRAAWMYGVMIRRRGDRSYRRAGELLALIRRLVLVAEGMQP